MAGRLDGKVALISGGVICLALILLTNSTVARGEDRQDSSEQIDCSMGYWDDLVYCAAQDATRAEERLKVLINELRPTFSDALRAEFDGLQQLWLKYRERYCLWERAYYRVGSPTGRRTMYWHCIEDATMARISDLESLSSRLAYEHEEGRQDRPEKIYCTITAKWEETADREKERRNTLRSLLDDDLRAEFDGFQQLWLKYRERHCLWERAYFGIGSGTRGQAMYFECMRAMTETWRSHFKGCRGICEG